MNDHQSDNRPFFAAGIATVFAVMALLAADPATAAAWLACNAPQLTPPASIERQGPPYPESARLAGAEGFVEVAFTVLRDGRVGWVRIQRAEPSGFFEAAAIASVRDWRFDPARRDGESVECRIQTRLRFTLTDTVAVRPAGPVATAPADDALPPPVFPDSARAAALEGYVEVFVEVGADGRVMRAEVTLAMPRGAFEDAALAAVRGWRFEPADAGGTEPRRLTRRFDFSLPGSTERPPSPMLLAAAPLPTEACTRRIPGQVRLEVTTDPDGRITGARILDADPPALFDATALAIARNSRMAPAFQAGEPVAATALLTLRFDPDTAHCPGDAVDPGSRGPRRGPTPRVSAAPAE